MDNSRNIKYLVAYLLPLTAVGMAVFAFLSPSAYDDAQVALALRLTAWLAFVIYVVVFVARPLRQLFPHPFTASILRIRPFVGLGLAAAMTVHLALIGWRFFNSLAGDVISKPSDPVYVTIGVLMVFAIAVRVAAFVKQRSQRTAAIASDR